MAETAAAKKHRAKGPRQLFGWGSITVTRDKKKVKVNPFSTIPKSTMEACGLKVAKPPASAGVKTKKDKKGRLRLVNTQSVTTVSSKHILVYAGETDNKAGQVWHQIALPSGISLARGASILTAGGSKIEKVKFPNGRAIQIGKKITPKASAKKK
jgi:hypothetical protein